MTDEAGREGEGEASPLAPFSRDDVTASERALAEAAGQLGEVDDDAPALEAIGRGLEGWTGEEAPSARFALETALFDVVSQQRGLSVAACLGGSAPPDATVPVNALLLPDPLDSLAERAARLAANGYDAIKIKLRSRDDAGFARELAALREVRARLPVPYEIRLDANAAWSLDVARRRLDALAEISPRYVEQPVPHDVLHRLGECAVPWAADESLAVPDLVELLLVSPGCAAFVLKPAILGGLSRARDLALRAGERGIGVVITHLCDGPFAMAAACELALSLPGRPLACGLAPHEDFAAFLSEHGDVGVPQLARRTVVRSSNGAGLGVRKRGVP